MMDSGKVLRFCVVGLATAVLQFSLVYIGVELLFIEATLTSSVTFAIIILFNYLMHYNWTFSVQGSDTGALSRYLVMICCGFFINGFIMYVGTALIGLNYLFVQMVAFAVIIVWNFCLSLLWVFKG